MKKEVKEKEAKKQRSKEEKRKDYHWHGHCLSVNGNWRIMVRGYI